MARVIAGGVADWLASRRGELNLRFERTRRRFPALAAEAVLANLADLLPPLAGPEPASGDLLSSVYDLILLHTARDAFAARPGLVVLFGQVFPSIRHILLQRPSVVPGALSNAVENLGSQGASFAEALGHMSGSFAECDMLLDAAAVLAWRLGEARLRESALETATRLPADVLLKVLGLTDWPAAAAPLVIDDLRTNGWRHPRALLTDQTIRTIRDASPADVGTIKRKILNPAPSPARSWMVVAKVGAFAGFDGNFDSPPVVLDGGGRHHVFARCGSQDFRIDADIFGWVCRPHPGLDLPVRATGSPSVFRRLVARFTTDTTDIRLLSDGTLTMGGDSALLPALSGALSYTTLPSYIATTHADSHRIRIAIPTSLPL